MDTTFRRLAIVLALLLATSARGAGQAGVAQESPHPSSIALWPHGAPGAEARKGEPEKVDWRDERENTIRFPVLFNVHNPSITPFLPVKDKATGAAVIIAPGGGHMFHTIDREGYDLGRWLADHGIAAFVLKYRLERDRAGASPYKTDPDALNDAKRAMRVVRSRAAEWGLDPKKVGFLGFSAGGQVAGLLALKCDNGEGAADPIDRLSCQPDFLGFIYGGPYRVADFSATPMAPSFLLCAFNDDANAENLANLFVRLKAARVPAELHIYGKGGHGFGVRTDRSLAVESWPARFREWLIDIGMVAAVRAKG